MPDDEWYVERRRIPLTKGWGPWQRTHWVPIDEFSSRREPDGTTRTSHWSLRVEPAALHGPPTRDRMMLDDDDDRLPGRYAGFRERLPNEPGWRYPPFQHGAGQLQVQAQASAPTPAPVQPRAEVPRQGQYQGYGRGPIIIPGDEELARRLQEEEYQGLAEQQYNDNIDRLNNQIAEGRARIDAHIDRYVENIQRPLEDERLTQLRGEIAGLDAERQRRRRGQGNHHHHYHHRRDDRARDIEQIRCYGPIPGRRWYGTEDWKRR